MIDRSAAWDGLGKAACIAFLLFLVLVPPPGSGVAAPRTPAGQGMGGGMRRLVSSQAMPPHPSLKTKIEAGAVTVPLFFRDPARVDPRAAAPARGVRQVNGTINALAVLVDFSDKIHTVDASFFRTLIFEAPRAGRGSVRDYFAEVSYGAVDIVTVNLPDDLGWRRAPGTYSSYVSNNYCTDAPYPRNCQKLAEDIVDAVDGVVNFSNYDNDGDGTMEPIMLVHAGRGAEFSGSKQDIWSHSWSLHAPRTYDGVTIADYVIMPEYWQTVSEDGSDMTIGVFAHEMGHGFWNLPDLYDRDYSSEGIGAWSLMAGGSWNGPNSGGWGTDGSSPAWPDAWSRVQMGLVMPAAIVDNVLGRSLPQAAGNGPPIETVLKLDAAGLAGQEYVLLENRQRAGGSYDEYLPAGGLLIWHVDEAMDLYTLQNDKECTLQPHCNCSDTQHLLVALEQADGLLQLENNANRGDGGDPFPGTAGNRAWTDATDPESSSWYACGETCIQVANVSDSAATMTADLQVLCPPPAATWVGTTTSWLAGSNWTGGLAPTCAVAVTIPTTPGGGNFPTVDGPAAAGRLTIESGARVNMAAHTLSVCGDLDAQGSGRFNGTGGTVILKGSGAQAVSLAAGANGQFYNLRVGDTLGLPAVTANTDLEIDGGLTIQPGASLAVGARALRLAGNWLDQGIFDRGTGTLLLDGVNQSLERRVAATILGSEGFESSFPPAGWSLYNVDGAGNQWQRTTVRGHTGTASAVHLYHATVTEDGWLRTPQLELGSAPVLRFWESVDWSSYYVRHSLWACSTGCDAPPANWAQVAEFDWPVEDTWREKVVSLDAYGDQLVYLAFRYQGLDGASWYIDDVSLSVWLPTSLAFYNLDVAGTGVARLQGDLALDGNLAIGSGATLDLGTRQITAVGGSVTNNGGLRQTQTAASLATTAFLNVPGGKYYGLEIYPTSGSMEATTVTIYGNQTCPNLSTAVRRCFEIAPGISRTADVTFYYRDDEANGQAAPRVYHWNGSLWAEQTLLGRDTSGVENNWVEAGGVSSYSPFALGTAIPTAVSLARLEALPQAGAVRLEWETVSEVNTLGFVVYRGESAGDPGERISGALVAAQVPGSPVGAGYSWVDREVQAGAVYYYWLEEVNAGGRPIRHGPVSATIKEWLQHNLPPRRRIIPPTLDIAPSD